MLLNCGASWAGAAVVGDIAKQTDFVPSNDAVMHAHTVFTSFTVWASVAAIACRPPDGAPPPPPPSALTTAGLARTRKTATARILFSMDVTFPLGLGPLVGIHFTHRAWGGFDARLAPASAPSIRRVFEASRGIGGDRVTCPVTFGGYCTRGESAEVLWPVAGRGAGPITSNPGGRRAWTIRQGNEHRPLRLEAWRMTHFSCPERLPPEVVHEVHGRYQSKELVSVRNDRNVARVDHLDDLLDRRRGTHRSEMRRHHV
jgi:hypothetical protein